MVSLNAVGHKLKIALHLLLLKLFASLFSLFLEGELALLTVIQNFRVVVWDINATLDLILNKACLPLIEFLIV